MTSQPGKQTNAIHMLPNISRNKGNQTMLVIFLQLIEHNTNSQTFFSKIKFKHISGSII